jgi:hypothetical protein
MAAIAEPPSPTNSAETRAHRSTKPRPLSEEELAHLRARHKRNEIIGLVAFCVVLAIVFVMRNYAS